MNNRIKNQKSSFFGLRKAIHQKWALLCLFFVGIFLTGACATPITGLDGSTTSPTHPRVRFLTGQGPVVFLVEVARTQSERQNGLMYRTNLASDEGMLFLMDDDSTHPFWMKNTPLSLDLIFIDRNFEVVDVHHQATPYSEEAIYSKRPYFYVVEINGGIAQSRGIRAGTPVELINL